MLPDHLPKPDKEGGMPALLQPLGAGLGLGTAAMLIYVFVQMI